MARSLEYYKEQRDFALAQAELETFDRAGWLRLAEEWGKLAEVAAAELEHGDPERPKPHILDS